LAREAAAGLLITNTAAWMKNSTNRIEANELGANTPEHRWRKASI
jgi:hypothetical protein